MLMNILVVWVIAAIFNIMVGNWLGKVFNDSKLTDSTAMWVYVLCGPMLSLLIIGGFTTAIWRNWKRGN